MRKHLAASIPFPFKHLLFFVFATLLMSCSGGGPDSSTPPAAGTYEPGVVLVSFRTTATVDDLNNFISKYGLQWDDGPRISAIPLFRAYVTFSDIDNVQKREEEINRISASAQQSLGQDYVMDQTFVYVENYGGVVLVIGFTGRATHDDARQLIQSLTELNLIDIVDDPGENAGKVFSTSGLVKVPVGEEIKWINMLKNDPVVFSAELNFIVTAADCTGNDLNTYSPVGTELSLNPGQQVSIIGEDLTVEFKSVSNESRCPTDAKCVWAGYAEVNVKLTKTGDPSSAIQLYTPGYVQLGLPNQANYLNYTIRITELQPLPKLNSTIEQTNYEAKFIVSKS